MARKPLTATVNVIMEDKSIKPFEKLTSDEVEKLRQNVKKRLESAMSLYL
mgnify:FL=1